MLVTGQPGSRGVTSPRMKSEGSPPPTPTPGLSPYSIYCPSMCLGRSAAALTLKQVL